MTMSVYHVSVLGKLGPMAPLQGYELHVVGNSKPPISKFTSDWLFLNCNCIYLVHIHSVQFCWVDSVEGDVISLSGPSILHHIIQTVLICFRFCFYGVTPYYYLDFQTVFHSCYQYQYSNLLCRYHQSYSQQNILPLSWDLAACPEHAQGTRNTRRQHGIIQSTVLCLLRIIIIICACSCTFYFCLHDIH